MPNGIELGKAYVQIVPSADGISSDLKDVLSGSLNEVAGSVKTQAMAVSGDIIKGVGDFGTAVLKDAFGSGSEFQQTVQSSIALLGLSGEEAQRFKTEILNISKDYQFTANEAALATEQLVRSGFNGQEALNVLGTAMAFAGANNVSLTDATDVLTATLYQFGLGATDASRVADVLTAAAANSNTSVLTLGESLAQVGPVAGGVTYTLEDTALVLGVLGNNAIQDSAAGTQLRAMIASLYDPTKDTQAAMDALNVSMVDQQGNVRPLSEVLDQLRETMRGGNMTSEEFNASINSLTQEFQEGKLSEDEYSAAMQELCVQMYGVDEARKIEYAANIAGREAMAGFLSIVNAAPEDYEQLRGAIADSTGATQEFYDIMQDTAQGALAKLNSAIDVLKISLGTTLLPAAQKLIEHVTDLVNGFNELDPAVQDVILGAAGLALGLSPVLSLFGNILKVVGAIGPAFTAMQGIVEIAGGAIGGVISGLSTAIGDLFGFIVANPIVGVIAIITAAVVALGVFLYKHWDEVKAGVAAVGEWISQRFQEAADFVSAVWEGIAEFFSGVWESIKSVFDGVGAFFTEAFTQAKDAAVAAWDSAVDAFNQVWANIQSVFQGVSTWFAETFSQARDAAATAFEAIKDRMTAVIDGIKAVYESMVTWFGETFGRARDAAAAAWENVTAKFEAAREKIKGVFSGIEDWFYKTFDTAKERAVKAWDSVKTSFTKIWNDIKSCFKLSDVISWGRDLVKNFVDGVKSAWESAKSGIVSMCTGIKNLLGFSEPKEGPLSDFHTYAPDMMQLFAQGIMDNRDVIANAFNQALDLSATPALSGLTVNPGAMASGSSRNTTYIFNSPKALDPVEAMRQAKKASQRMTLAYA